MLFGFMAAVIVAILATGCAGNAGKYKQKELVMDAQFYFDRGVKLLKKKEYARAIEEFNTVVESFSGSAVVDSALFYLAESHFKNEDYLTAAYNYERVYTDYPSSEFVAESQYKKALSYYMESPKAALDQENTRLAMDEFGRFIENFPSNPLIPEAQKRIEELREKLAYKDYSSAELYRRMKNPESLEAALIYYQSVIDEYPRSIWVDHSRLGMGIVYLMKKDRDKAREIFKQLTESDRTNPSVKKNALKRLKELK
jgi:outer membrane protein assembly factor BamD